MKTKVKLLGILCFVSIVVLNTFVLIKPANALVKDYTFGWHYVTCPDGVQVIRCENNPSGEKCYVWSQATCNF